MHGRMIMFQEIPNHEMSMILMNPSNKLSHAESKTASIIVPRDLFRAVCYRHEQCPDPRRKQEKDAGQANLMNKTSSHDIASQMNNPSFQLPLE